MNAHAEVEFESWQIAGYPVTIEYDPAIMNDIRSEAIEGLNRLSRGGLEIGGILFGRRDGNRISVTSHRPAPCEYASGPTFTLSANDERTLESLLSAPGLQAVGWYHSHTRGEIALSAKDIQLFDRFFPEPWQIALVVHPHRFDPARAGFFFREPDGSIHAESTYREFLLKPKAGASTPLEAARPEVQESRPGPPAPAAPPAGRRAEAPPPHRRWTFAAALMAAAALTASLSFLYSNSLRQAPANLALRVFDTGGQLRIDWDRDAATVRRAENAIIEINDGGTKRNEALDASQLRTGSVTYLRSSGDVAVRLRVISADRRVIDETTRFIGPPVQTAGNADRLVEEVVVRPKKRAPRQVPKSPVLPVSDASPLTESAAPDLETP